MFQTKNITHWLRGCCPLDEADCMPWLYPCDALLAMHTWELPSGKDQWCTWSYWQGSQLHDQLLHQLSALHPALYFTSHTNHISNLSVFDCMQYVSQKKVPTFKLSVTLSNLNWFSKFLHFCKTYEMCYKTHMTSSHLRHAAALPW